MVELTIPFDTSHEEAMIMINNIQNLTVLYCYNTLLTSLPTSLPNLKILICSFTRLTSLPSLPNLETLVCSNTQIASLPSLPNLTLLWCDFMTIEDYKIYLKNSKILLIASIQILRKDSNLGLKNISIHGFNLARLIKELL